MALDQLNFKDKKNRSINTKRCFKNIKNRKFNKFKKSYGGTSLQNVVKMLKKLKKEFK